MFERFTERARQVVVLAQDEARQLKHNYIGTEHLLLGLMREEEGLAAHVLDELGFDITVVRKEIRNLVGEGAEVTTGQIPFTPRAKTVLDLSMREALSLGHNYIGTEHILLGLVREPAGAGAKLVEKTADVGAVRETVIRLLVGSTEEARKTRQRTHRTRVQQRAEKALADGPTLYGVLQEERTFALHDHIADELRRSMEGSIDAVVRQIADAIRMAYTLGISDGFVQGVAAASEGGEDATA